VRRVNGETKVYNGLVVDGVASKRGENQTPDYRFCTNVWLDGLYWTVEGSPGNTVIGIAVGNFVDQDFPAPMREYHTAPAGCWEQQTP
jgi:hypothetical protein